MTLFWRGFIFSLLILTAAGPATGQNFPRPLPTPCDNYAKVDQRPGFKRDDPDVYFQWMAAQAEISSTKWCVYYAVKNLHARNNLAFRWPTAHLEKALLAPAGIVDVMTSPINPAAPKDNDPLYYGAVSPPPPPAMTTIFNVQASAKTFPQTVSLEVNALGLGGSGGTGAPRLDFRGLIFASSVEHEGAQFTYHWRANTLAVSSTAQVSISWYPTKDPVFVKDLQRNFPTASYGKDVLFVGGSYVSSTTFRKEGPNLAFSLAKIRVADREVLTLSVPVIRPDQ